MPPVPPSAADADAVAVAKTDGHSGFCMFHPLEARKYFAQIKRRELMPRDFAVLFAVLSLCDTKTGRVRFIIQELGEELGMHPTVVSSSIRRLKKHLLIANCVDPDGDRYYLINPYLLSVGRRQRWGLLLKRFELALE
jgi:hypothetical protein